MQSPGTRVILYFMPAFFQGTPAGSPTLGRRPLKGSPNGGLLSLKRGSPCLETSGPRAGSATLSARIPPKALSGIEISEDRLETGPEKAVTAHGKVPAWDFRCATSPLAASSSWHPNRQEVSAPNAALRLKVAVSPPPSSTPPNSWASTRGPAAGLRRSGTASFSRPTDPVPSRKAPNWRQPG